MNKIEVRVLNPEIIQDVQKMAVCCARLTQHGHEIKSADDFVNLYNKSFKETTYDAMVKLSHTTLQRFCNINVVIVGASRRALSQLSRHRTGITFMSASLQYSDYGNDADFVIPYEVMQAGQETIDTYLKSCEESMNNYKKINELCGNHDAAGFAAPQGLRNVLVISANPLAWKQMITQRVCKRNSKETEYVMLKIWEELYKLDPHMFDMSTTGAGCQQKGCQEGKMSCKCPFAKTDTPSEILRKEFPLLYEND